MVVGIEDVLLVFRMARDMNLRDPVGWHSIHVYERIEVVILRRNIDVVHVEQNPAISLLHNLIQELPLCHLRNVVFGVAADVLYDDGNFDKILNLTNLLRHDLGSFERIRHRQQIMRVAAVDTAPAQVIGEPRRSRSSHEVLQAF